jgi:hypothetical protein
VADFFQLSVTERREALDTAADALLERCNAIQQKANSP